MNKINKIFPNIAVATGVIANSILYWMAFSNMGFGKNWLGYILIGSIVIAVMSFEITMWVKKTPRIINPAKIAVLILSISTTQCGQFYATSEEEVKESNAIARFQEIETEISELKSELSDIPSTMMAEIESIDSQISGIDNMINTYMYLERVTGESKKEVIMEAQRDKGILTNSIQNVRDYYASEKTRINNEITILENEKKSEDVSRQDTMNTYEYMAGKLKIDESTVRQISQLFASLILSLIAPLSLYIKRVIEDSEGEQVSPSVTVEKEFIEKDTDNSTDGINNKIIVPTANIDACPVEEFSSAEEARYELSKNETDIKPEDIIPKKKQDSSLSEPRENIEKDSNINPNIDMMDAMDNLMNNPDNNHDEDSAFVKEYSRSEPEENRSPPIPPESYEFTVTMKKNTIKALFQDIDSGKSRKLLTVGECLKLFEESNKHNKNVRIPRREDVMNVSAEIIENSYQQFSSSKEVIRRMISV